MTNSSAYIRTFDAFIAVADLIRSESTRGVAELTPALLKQANSLVDSLNDTDVLPYQLEPIEISDWPGVLRQISLIVALGGRERDQIEVGPNRLADADVVDSPILNVTASVEPSRIPRRPVEVFIGCSVEGLAVAKILQLQLRHTTKPIIWSQGVFGLSTGTLETLVAESGNYDYAILVLTPDDTLIKRNVESNTSRDNVLFELGLFIGALGRRNVFMVVESTVELPTDLAGIAPAKFTAKPVGKELQQELGPVSTQLELAMDVL